MGSQTLEILRQGVWASLTGGWFYDPHQGVFCNVVHLYLWLFLLCSPFIAYLYFPATLLTWSIYCFSTSLTILCVKIANMALHRLYDQAQTMSESNLKNAYFKVTKNGDGRDDEAGIEMQVMRNDVPSQNSVEQAINEASDENSIMSMDNANSIQDLKVDVHRKNSSESIELMFYAPSVLSSPSQHDHQSITTGSNSVSKSFRSTTAGNTAAGASDMNAKFLTVYPEHEKEKSNIQSATNSGPPSSRSSQRLHRKSSGDFKHRQQRRRLERQKSLDVTAESALVSKLGRNQMDSLSTVLDNYCIDTFLHPQPPKLLHQTHASTNSTSASKVNTSTLPSTSMTTTLATATVNSFQRLPTRNANAAMSMLNSASTASIATNSHIIKFTQAAQNSKTARLQRHRSSETHDERIKQQNRGLFLPIHHEHHHVSSDVGSSSALAGIRAVDELELRLGGSTGVGASSIGVRRRGHGLLSLVFGSSSDVYLDDDSFTKSDLGIEQLDKHKESDSSGGKSQSAIVLQQQQSRNLHYYQPQQQFRQHHHVTNIRKDSNSSMSALQLSMAPPSTSKHLAKRRRHSNATSLYKIGVSSGAAVGPAPGIDQQSTVRRIKSAALEIGCPQPSVSNLVPHPNSVEAISGQQQIKNPKSALLPPPSKCLVRNPHLYLCPAYGGSFESSGSSLNLGASGSGSTTALIDPVYPIVEQADEKASIDSEVDGNREDTNNDLKLENDSIDAANADALEEETMHMILGGVFNDDDDVIDLDHVPIAEHSHFKTNQLRTTCESDVSQILDNDEFKGFEENSENISKIIQADELLRSICKHEEDSTNIASDSESSEAGAAQNCAEATTNTKVYDERLQSSDSETDKNGSRSPLLSSSKGRDRGAAGVIEKSSLADKTSEQQKPTMYNRFPQHMSAKGEEDSGCPSSDCEQVSASSKDMLLSSLNAPNISVLPKCIVKSDDSNAKHLEDAKESSKPTATVCNSTVAGKNLGAIPKVVKYREIDETRTTKDSSHGQVNDSLNSQLHKRRSASNEQNATANNSISKAISRTSSSTSSVSFSADSFSADIHKMLWLMSGGAVDDNGRPLNTGRAEDAQSTPAQSNVVPSSMSVAHFQFYQDALNALHSHPSNSVDGLSISDRMYLREKIRRTSKQISEARNLSTGDFPHSHDLTNALSNGGATSVNSQAIGAIVSPPAFRSDTQTPSIAPPLTIQGLIDVINDGRHGQVQTRLRAGKDDLSSSAVLNIDNQQISSYCDYWRPACMLSTEKALPTKSFYKYRFKMLGFDRELKISMDRLELLALFDRDLHWIHIILSVVLAAIVSYLGATILQLGFYKDLFAFLFCAVMAGSQYSLLKSVQPDAASPIHGFNKTVAYSRAIYFSCCGGLLILLHDMTLRYEKESNAQLIFFGMHFLPLHFIKILLYAMYLMLLCFPLIFSLGLFPQINTFLMYLLEQVDMHIFGGNASSSLLGSFLCVMRSFLAVLILYGPLFAGLAEGKGTQYIVFSIFCAMLLPIGYHLSRSASDFCHLWALIKNTIVSTYRDDDDELSATTSSADCQSKKQTTRTPKQSNADASEGAATNDSDHNKMSSLDKLPQIEQASSERKKCRMSSVASSSQTIPKTPGSSKNTVTASNSITSVDDNQCILGLVPVNVRTSSTDGDDEKDGGRKQTCAAVPPIPNDDKVSTSSTTNPGDISTLTAGGAANENSVDNDAESPDPLPMKLRNTVNTRLKNDFVVSALLAVFVLALHSSTVFSVLQPDLNIVLYGMSGALGLLLHYLIPQMRKHMPWLCFARPLLRQKEFGQFEVASAAAVMWFEKVYIYLSMLERNVLFPLLVISALTADAQTIANKFGIPWGALIIATCALKFVRNAYSDPTNQYLIVMFTVLFFRVDFVVASETFLIDYFFVSIGYRKCSDFLLKLQFIVTYIAPWQITWGSAFHAFAQPFSVPHSAMLFLQAGISALLSTPLNPFLGSAIFLTSYVRPIKFWERDYNTRRSDHSNTRLSSQLERDLGADDNNLNSIFYEHLTRSLQHSLCGDLLMGRWGNVNQGDCFVLASDYLNCLVHIIELGNGLCTFQMRGLEFRGTYCQQREVEAISEDVEDNDGCCCCDPGHLPRMLSANAMFSTRWLAWQVVAAQYVLEGYSISDNLASATLQVFEYRKVLITYYIKSIIYYVIKNPKLEKWLSSGPIQDALQHTLSRQFVDLDPIFNYNLDEDFDFRALGITRTSFCFVYLGWIQHCWCKRRDLPNQPNCGQATPSAVENPSQQTTQPNRGSQGQVQSQPQSQTQLRSRPQKSATISGTVTGSAVNASPTMMHSSEHTIATSQSFVNISRQNSESAPGLSGVNTAVVNGTTNIPIPLPDSLDHSSSNVGTSQLGSESRVPQKPAKMAERYYKLDSPTAETIAAQQKNYAQQPAIAKNSPIVSLCLALGLLARRSLATASHSSLTGIEFFLHGLHALFKGDFRITSPRDEWVFADMELLHSVVAPAVKMALKLQQDHISNPDEFLDPEALYAAISEYSTNLVISHEADPVWRSAVLRGASNLLALRHVLEDGSDEYRIIRLTKRFLSFRVIKLNRECVRGLWAGQQQELIYLRNRNPERGSIQNAKQALRNIINSSCDQPIGYPIYVSPLTTSYADTNEQLCQVVGGPITPETIKSNVIDWWQRVREKCRQGCSSGSALEVPPNLGSLVGGIGCPVNVGSESGDLAPVFISAPLYNTLTLGNFFGLRIGSVSGQYGSQSFVGVAPTRNGLPVMNKPTSSTLLAGFLNRERDLEREREAVQDPRILRKNQTHLSSRCDAERSATLPISTSSFLGALNDANSSHVETGTELMESDKKNPCHRLPQDSRHCYTKISSSSGNLGMESIITTPGEFPRKSKGPICLTAAAAGAVGTTETLESKKKALIETFKKVIIVDGTEIYDCLDLGRRIDVVWPSEKMRANGGRLSWKDWSPHAGMVGYVVHHWLPNHADKRFRSHVNRTLYLVEIGDHYVPVGEFGVREYYSVVGSRENLDWTSNRCALQIEYDERLEREGLTPILGSSLESPMRMPTASNSTDALTKLSQEDEVVGSDSGLVPERSAAKITALSTSSSGDEEVTI